MGSITTDGKKRRRKMTGWRGRKRRREGRAREAGEKGGRRSRNESLNQSR